MITDMPSPTHRYEKSALLGAHCRGCFGWIGICDFSTLQKLGFLLLAELPLARGELRAPLTASRACSCTYEPSLHGLIGGPPRSSAARLPRVLCTDESRPSQAHRGSSRAPVLPTASRAQSRCLVLPRAPCPASSSSPTSPECVLRPPPELCSQASHGKPSPPRRHPRIRLG